MGWYIVVKRVIGRGYLYRQRSYRDGESVRTESKYIGPVDAVRDGTAKLRLNLGNVLGSGAENVDDICRDLGLETADATVVGQLFDAEHAVVAWQNFWDGGGF